MFGLTATGKSTWSCHQLGLDPDQGEGTWVAQDDIVWLRRDGSSYGTEQGFYVKTDVDLKLQEAMYHALAHKSALLENMMVEHKGRVDFLDERLGENGRGVLDRRQLVVERGRRMASICADSINLPPLDQLDGIVFAFITRRATIMPFAQRLTPQQGVLAYLWGESTHSFATVPEKAGESVRIVGMDDFIIGNQGRKVNAFHDIVMDLVDRYPGKVHFFQYNTGGVGEIIEIDKATGARKLVRKVTRVPIDLMAALQRGDLRGTNEYAKGRLGTEEVVRAEGTDLSAYRAENFYSSRADRGLRGRPGRGPPGLHRGDRRPGAAPGDPRPGPPRAGRDRRQAPRRGVGADGGRLDRAGGGPGRGRGPAPAARPGSRPGSRGGRGGTRCCRGVGGGGGGSSETGDRKPGTATVSR